jgi:ribosomal protein S18 acetylase RimI-like enzyme
MADSRQPFLIRAAVPADADDLAALAERSFREAWAAYNDPTDMDEYCAANFRSQSVRDDFGRSGVRYLLAEADGELAGYLRMEASAPPPCVSAWAPIEISRLYVLRPWQGRGMALALMRMALAEASLAGHDIAWLAVWQRAAQALAFYRKCGFDVVGNTTFRLGSDAQDDFVMSRSCQANS